MNFPESQLLVLEYGGTSRGGKGTILKYLAEQYEGVATEETGADYRAITMGMIEARMLEPGMDAAVVAARVSQFKAGDLTDMVAGRNQLVAEHGLASLYTPEVTGLVSDVSPLTAIRTAVKAGFTKRVEAVVAAGEAQILAVDGRNLAPVVEKIAGTRLLLRTFVTCDPFESAIRERDRTCHERGIDLTTEAGRREAEPILWDSYRVTVKRNKDDANRKHDPVRPDPDAIDYWYDKEAVEATVISHAVRSGNPDYTDAFLDLFRETDGTEYTNVPRQGVGALAVRAGRQILFDTSPFRGACQDPKGGMVAAADQMYQEALWAANQPTLPNLLPGIH